MRYLAAILILLAFCASEARAEDVKPRINCPGNQKNLRTYLKIHDILFTERDVSRVGEFYAPDMISHNQDSGGDSKRKVTLDQLKAMWTASKRNNPERRLVDDLIICSGDYVTVRTQVHSTDNTGVAGNAPTHKPYVISAIDIYRFKNGKVVERWGDSNLMGMVQQVGLKVVPGEQASAATP
jgi:predicted ester cyclase